MANRPDRDDERPGAVDPSVSGTPFEAAESAFAEAGESAFEFAESAFGEVVLRSSDVAEAEAAWSGLTVPTRYVTGSRDPFFGRKHADRTAALRPSPERSAVLLEGAGHHPRLDVPLQQLTVLIQVIGESGVHHALTEPGTEAV